MKIRKCLTLMLWGVMTVPLAAEQQCVLNVNLDDGSSVQFVLPVQQPTITCGNGEMIINYEPMNGAENNQWLSFKRDQVANLTFGTIDTTDIDEVQSGQGRVSFDLTRAGLVHIAGLQANDQLNVFALDGKRVQANIIRQDSEATVDLNGLPHGYYVVNVNQRFTFKLMKP